MTQTVTEKLTRNTAIKENMDPFGVRWGICPAAGGYGLYAIGKVVEGELVDVDGELPQPRVDLLVTLPSKQVEGMFTSVDKAQSALRSYLNTIWTKSDAAEKKTELRTEIKQHQNKSSKKLKD